MSVYKARETVRRAHVAQRTWALASPGYRASALREFARAVTAHRDELAALETSNAGHLAAAPVSVHVPSRAVRAYSDSS